MASLAAAENTAATHTAATHTAGPTRRRGARTRLLAAALLTAVVAAGCQVPYEQWVPDLDGDGVLSAAEIDRQTQIVVQAVQRHIDEKRRSVQQHPFLTCVRHHESDRGPWPHTNGYTAQNPRSSASGAYQFIDGTWRTVSAQAGHPGYSRAMHAPWYVQDAVALWLYQDGGAFHWRGTGCS